VGIKEGLPVVATGFGSVLRYQLVRGQRGLPPETDALKRVSRGPELVTTEDVPTPEALATVAEDAARDAGAYLRESFRTDVEATFGTDDVKSDADEIAEARITETIRESYPDHVVHGEENGRSGEGPVEWIVDPLDGTNNFAIGHSSVAVAVAVRHDEETLAAVIYEPLLDDCYRAIRGEGATVNGEPIRADHDRALARSTVSFVVGINAVRDDELRAEADLVRERLWEQSKRVLETWSPCVDWGLFARGSLAGIVCAHPDLVEQAAGELLAAEAGAVSTWEGDYYVAAPTEARLAALCETLPE
jgi:myo-inositol-1(or 4)-monophosphatase